MRILLTLGLLSAVAIVTTVVEAAPTPGPQLARPALMGPLLRPATAPLAAAAKSRPPTKLNAPSAGLIGQVDAKAGKIRLADKEMLIGPPYLALIDKRPNATGLLSVATLRPGMRVRYRVQNHAASAAPRVVELWVLHDAVPLHAQLKTGSVK